MNIRFTVCNDWKTFWGRKQKTEEREKKEVTATNGLVDELIDQLSVKTVFTIPIFGGIKIAESVVVMWIIMAIVIVASIFLTRNLSMENPGKRQLFLEVCIGKFYGFFEGLLGEEGKCYIPYLMSVGLFIGIANVIGLLGFKPPTKDLNCTIALALVSIILVEAAGIRAKGVKKWAKGFTQPVAIITPINILEIFIRPFSLCLRLFGNVLGAFVIMELIKAVVPMVVPLVFSFYFDIFDGLIQAYVFVFLTSLYIKEAIELQAE